MIAGARIAAAIEVLADIEARRRPAADALKDWGLAHRFAGSKDRSSSARSSSTPCAGARSSAFSWARTIPAQSSSAPCDSCAVSTLTKPRRCFRARPMRRRRLTKRSASVSRRGASRALRPMSRAISRPGSNPPSPAVFGERLVAETSALALRAPVDLRVNTLKAARDKALASLAHLNAGADAPLAHWPSPAADARGARSRARGRGRLHQGPRRDSGRGLAARGAPFRRQARRAGSRPLRRRRRKDAGARRSHAEQAARFTPPTTMAAGLRRSTSGLSGRARAMSRFARRAGAMTCSPILRAPAISC